MTRKTYNSGGNPPDTRKLVAGLLQQGDAICFKAFGPSMNPVIRSGETVLVHPVAAGDCRPGSILLFKYHGRLVLHRFIRHSPEGRLITVADAALSGRDAVDAKDILGRADSVNRRERDRRLDTRLARGYGLLRYYSRPLRRLVTRLVLKYR